MGKNSGKFVRHFSQYFTSLYLTICSMYCDGSTCLVFHCSTSKNPETFWDSLGVKYSASTGKPSMILSDHTFSTISAAAMTGKRKMKINSIADNDKQDYVKVLL